jgi:hypothetical protein
MDCFILRQNIAIFQRALTRETDLVLRQTVWDLLADAEAELAQLEAAATVPAEITTAAWPAPRRGIMELPRKSPRNLHIDTA